ncbi:hypothetical protein F5879DRAFT_431423 [Lentinula edodes]|uniref:Uncharacterized protein n=1 Tax=Lentinula edodes TaxID=5353 RepID=A0A1Q3E521_LENED|nr:uncharacterized protein C8R40DRAFT_154595 [Lentinula edodes]KAF8827848.1 hypothetical protein HHX47_DHR4000828 [Lentinula edodes]KAH7876198.1 hypothetical protein C8R40DRAFT_154595 [Lentinula edodes]KAJ3900289.1 hypothetical protein F5879DRAFT_431423 [Lentinula edodes]GAW02246.1 hypothetical protein LENED_003885 [Lentinula edodes]
MHFKLYGVGVLGLLSTVYAAPSTGNRPGTNDKSTLLKARTESSPAAELKIYFTGWAKGSSDPITVPPRVQQRTQKALDQIWKLDSNKECIYMTSYVGDVEGRYIFQIYGIPGCYKDEGRRCFVTVPSSGDGDGEATLSMA